MNRRFIFYSTGASKKDEHETMRIDVEKISNEPVVFEAKQKLAQIVILKIPEVELVEGHAMSDHVHLCLSIPPKLSVAYTIGRLKGKSAVRIQRDFIKGRGNAKGFHFWSTGYCVSTVGLDEVKVRQYIRHQEETERRQEELDLDD